MNPSLLNQSTAVRLLCSFCYFRIGNIMQGLGIECYLQDYLRINFQKWISELKGMTLLWILRHDAIFPPLKRKYMSTGFITTLPVLGFTMVPIFFFLMGE